MAYLPSTSVEAPRPVLTSVTFAPGSASPVCESLTTPLIVPLAANPRLAIRKMTREVTRKQRSILGDILSSSSSIWYVEYRDVRFWSGHAEAPSCRTLERHKVLLSRSHCSPPSERGRVVGRRDWRKQELR